MFYFTFTFSVMYTLYMAVSNKLPPTSYIKMIDIWLIFGPTLPFTVFFFHVLIEHLPSRHQNQETDMSNESFFMKNYATFNPNLLDVAWVRGGAETARTF